MSEVIGLPERRRRQRLLARLLLGAGLALAVVTAFGSYWFIGLQTAPPPPVERPRTPVVVAAVALDARTTIGPNDVKVVALDSELVPSGAFSEPAKVVGQIVTVPLVIGEPVLATKFVVASGAPFTVLPPGTTLAPATADYRALSINVGDANAVGGYVQAGDVVDIIYTITYEVPRSAVSGLPVAIGSTQGGALERAARVVFERVPILARTGTVYTIRLDAASAERLAVLQNSETQILFLLRAPRDDRATRVGGATLTNETLPFLRIPVAQR